MAATDVSKHGMWSSQWLFVLAAAGSAVGLGNIWKFPYIAGQNGGGAFVVVYLACVALIGIPIMMSEVLLGREGRQSPINTMRAPGLIFRPAGSAACSGRVKHTAINVAIAGDNILESFILSAFRERARFQ